MHGGKERERGVIGGEGARGMGIGERQRRRNGMTEEKRVIEGRGGGRLGKGGLRMGTTGRG